MYAMGRGIDRDDATAAYFFTMASKQGDALSERMLRQVGSPIAQAPSCLSDPNIHDSAGSDIIAGATPERRKVMDLVQKLAPEYGVYLGLRWQSSVQSQISIPPPFLQKMLRA
jgi:TPR repeat protein